MNIFRPKIIDTMKSYSGKQLASDLVAGLIVAIIALPLSIALAIASGVSPEKGLYTAGQKCYNNKAYTTCKILFFDIRKGEPHHETDRCQGLQ